jgi:hypothetical protein
MTRRDVPVKKYAVRLSEDERRRLEEMVRKGKSPANQSSLRRNGNWKMASRDRRPKPAPKGRKCQKLPARDRRPPA